MEKKITLKALLEREQVFAPCVYDCLSARAAELTGFKAILLSGGALAYSMSGVPDMALLTADEVVWATDRIATYSPLPLIVDADDGYGETPLNAYRTTARLVKAGAMALTLDDTTGVRGWERLVTSRDGPSKHEVIPREKWLAKVKASLAACEGTDCLLIARTECKFRYGLEEAIERCLRAIDLGAEMTLIIGLKTLEECQDVSKHVPGWKMYPDVMSKNGVPDVELDEIAPLGFNLVTMHYLEKGAMYGMLDYGKHIFADRNTAYSDEHDMGGLSKEEQFNSISMNYKKWLDFEKECQTF
jgi:methylisocitrate lyase